MTEEEIKLVLAGYRPEIYADEDPQIAVALAAAKADPKLTAWLEEQVAFDTAFTKSLQTVQPPAGAMDALLAEMTPVELAPEKSSEGSLASNAPIVDGETRENVVVKGRFGMNRRNLLMAAAAVLVLGAATVKYFVFPPPVEYPEGNLTSVDTYREHMAHFANSRFMLDKFFKDIEESRAWLAEQGYPHPEAIPGKIAHFKGMGCKAIDWSGGKVGLICFKDGEGEIVHLFVVEEEAFDNLAQPASPLEELLVAKRLETSGWRQNGKVLLFVGSEPDVSIADLL